MQIVIASDGSTDKTANIARHYAELFPGRVRLFDYPVRRGKATVLNDSLPQLDNEIVVLSDANTFFEPNAVRNLVRWFADPTIGVVCGQLRLIDPRTGHNVDSLYWRYENFLKTCEGKLGALLGANGAIYAIRRSRFVPIPTDTIIDDFVLPLLIRLRHGQRIVYDREAIAEEETPADVGALADGTVVEFTHPLCTECIRLEGELREQGRRVLTVDVSKKPDLARKYGVAVVPVAVRVSADGTVVGRLAG